MDPHPDASPRLRAAARASPVRSNGGSIHHRREPSGDGDELHDFCLDDDDSDDDHKYVGGGRRRRRRLDFALPSASQLLSLRYYRALSRTSQLLVALSLTLAALVLLQSIRPALHRLWALPLPFLHRGASPLAVASRLAHSLSKDKLGVIAIPRPDASIVFTPVLDDDHIDIGPHSELALPVYSAANVTLYTTFSPEKDHVEWQHAFYSWTQRLPHAQLLVFTATAAHCPLVHELSVDIRCRVSSCWDLVHDAVYLRCLMEEADAKAATELLLFVEDHIVIFNDLLPALLKVANTMPQWVVSGTSKEMRLQVDSGLDLAMWQKDLEHAYLYDSSAIATVEDTENVQPTAAELEHAHALHFFAYHRSTFPLAAISPQVMMGGGQYIGHEWEKILVSSLLLQNGLPLVDVSASVVTVALQHAEHGFANASSVRRINAINSELSVNVSGLPVMRLGRLENSHYVLTGKCPTCMIKENREADLPLILIRHANVAHQIIVIAVNADYLSLAFNWICRARVLQLSNYIMLAEDRVSYRILRKMDVAVVLRKDAPYKKKAAAFGSREFQETLYLRAIFIHQVITLGFDLVLSHLDTVWYEDPLPFFASSPCDMHVQFEAGDGKAGGGLLALRSTRMGRTFVNDYLECEFENYQFISLHGRGRFTYSDDPDIDCVELISQRIERRQHMRRCPLDPLLFVSERAFFDVQRPQHTAQWPMFVHLNANSGLANKTRVFMDWDLWGVDEANMTQIPLTLAIGHRHMELKCKPPPARIAMPGFEKVARMRVVVNVLASTEHFALGETLAHLAAAQYDADVKVDVHITIQQPEHESSSSSKNHVETTRTANDFRWPHGEKRLVYLDAYVGPSDRWIDSWSVDVAREQEDEEEVFQLALYAGMLVSSQWLVWTRKALATYYFHPFSYDPQLMGIHLMHAFLIPGETPQTRFGSRIPSQVLNGSGLYHYQLVPLVGTVFFPTHFLSFLHWYHGQVTAVPSTACVPTLISNRWYLADRVAHWGHWLTRFTFESGWYALYTNWHSANATKGLKPKGLLIDATPLSGQLTVLLIKRLGSRERELPDAHALRLYDFHFREVTIARPLLAYRKTLFPPMPVQMRSHDHDSEVRAREDSRLRREGDLSPEALAALRSDAHSEEGLWARLERHKDQVVDVGDVGAVHGEGHEPSADADATDVALSASSNLEPDVTATHLIIEMMVLAMAAEAEDDGSNMNAALDSTAYQQQLQRIRAKVQHSLSGLDHLHSNPRNPFNYSRCFTIDQLAEVEAHDDQRSGGQASSLLPAHLYSSYTFKDDIRDLYEQIYHRLTQRLLHSAKDADKDVRFIVYQPVKLVPFDRHLRGLYFCFLVALVTERVLLIDLPEFHLQYASPFSANVSWDLRDHAPFMRGKLLTNATMEAKEIEARLRTDDLNDVYPQHVLLHAEGVSHDRLMFKNKRYSAFLPTLFSSYSRMRRTGAVSKLLLQRPRPAFIAAAAVSLSALLPSPPPKYTVCAHVVAQWPSQGLPALSPAHWDCLVSTLIHQGWPREDTTIVVTAGRHVDGLKDAVEAKLGQYGHVVVGESLWRERWSGKRRSVQRHCQRQPDSGRRRRGVRPLPGQPRRVRRLRRVHQQRHDVRHLRLGAHGLQQARLHLQGRRRRPPKGRTAHSFPAVRRTTADRCTASTSPKKTTSRFDMAHALWRTTAALCVYDVPPPRRLPWGHCSQ